MKKKLHYYRKKSSAKRTAFFVLKQFPGALLISLAVMLSAFPVSCRLTEDGITLVAGEAEYPQVESFSVINSEQISLSCLSEFAVEDVVVKSSSSGEELATDVIYSADEKSADIYLAVPTEIGQSYSFSCTIKDRDKNSLAYENEFLGYNDHPARLAFSEIRTDYSGTSTPKRSELIEFIVTESGNTSGLEVISGNYGYDKKYVFPECEVSKDEIIVVHYRSLSDTGCVDEDGEDITIAEGPEAADEARDFWYPNEKNEKLLNKDDVIAVKNGADGTFYDILPLSSGKTEWTKTLMAELLQTASELELWDGGDAIENAADSSGMSAAHTLMRNSFEVPGSKDQWSITSSKTWTIGQKNY